MGGLKPAMNVARLDNWPERLADYFSSVHGTPLEWGVHDCVLFSLEAAKVQTGVDMASKLRGTYTNARGAAKQMLKRYGARTLPEAASVFAAALNIEEVPVLMAQRGDIVEANVTLPDDGTLSPAFGVVALDNRFAWFVGLEGLTPIRLRDCKRAWRI